MRGVAGLNHNGDRVTYHRSEKWHEILHRLKIDRLPGNVPLSDLLPTIADGAGAPPPQLIQFAIGQCMLQCRILS